jgi:hypothetical protein
MKLRLSSSLLAVFVGVPLLSFAMACGDDPKPQPVAPTNTMTAPPPTYTAPPPTYTAPPPTNTGTAPPPTGTTGGATGTATPLDANAAALATGPLAALAKTEAPGMTADGPVVAGTFQEGQTLEAPFTLQPGKCYTLVAAGAGPSHVEVEMMYTVPIPGIPAPSIGTSPEKGPTATIGGKGKCLKPISPIAATAKFILRAKKGAGVAAAQLYSK